MKEKINIPFLKNDEIPDVEFFKKAFLKFENEIKTVDENDYALIKKMFIDNLNIYPPMNLFFHNSSNDLYIYRARIINEEMEDISNIDTFSYCKKKELVSLGRANIMEHPVFYGSIDQDSALRESKDNVQPGQTLFIGKWKIKDNVKYQYCNFIFDNKSNILGEFLNTQNINLHNKLLNQLSVYEIDKQESMKYLTHKIGNFFLQNDYKISSFIAHYILYEQIKNNIFIPDMIMYPSIKSNLTSYNFAIAPNFVDECMELVEVHKNKITRINVKKQGSYINLLEIGKNENNKIIWYNRAVLIEKNLKLNKVGIFFEDDSFENIKNTNINDGYILGDNNKLTVEEFYKLMIPTYFDEISEACMKSIENIKEEQLYNEFEININIEISNDSPLFFKYKKIKEKIIMLKTNFTFKLEDVKINQ